MAFETKCQKCGEENLNVTSGMFEAVGMPLTADGFSTSDASQFNTENELVTCGSCNTMFELSDLHADEDDEETMKKPLYKSTIVIWSEFDPSEGKRSLEDLGREADQGEAYCSKSESVLVEDPAADADWDGTEFFGVEDGVDD